MHSYVSLYIHAQWSSQAIISTSAKILCWKARRNVKRRSVPNHKEFDFLKWMEAQRKPLVLSNVWDIGRKLVNGDYGLVTEMSYYGAPCTSTDLHEWLTKKVKQMEYLLDQEQCYNSDGYLQPILVRDMAQDSY